MTSKISSSTDLKTKNTVKTDKAGNTSKTVRTVNADKTGSTVNTDKTGSTVNTDKTGSTINADKAGNTVNTGKTGSADHTDRTVSTVKIDETVPSPDTDFEKNTASDSLYESGTDENDLFENEHPGEMNIRPYKSAGFFVRQRELAGRRLWSIALTFLSCMIYNVICTATVLSNTLENAALNHYSPARQTYELQDTLKAILGYHNFSWFFLALPLAALLAIEGFAWMDNRREVDFYESLPVPRRQRFVDICIGSILYFAFSYIITLEIGLLIAGGFGALSRAVLKEIVLTAIMTITLFIAIYALGVLSAMLTGNVIVACLAFIVLLTYEMEFRALLEGYCSEFFTTWSGNSSSLLSKCIFSPIGQYLESKGCLEAVLRLLALAILFFLLSWICCRLRRNERAGSAVIFDPVKSLVRVAMALLVGLVTGLLVLSIRTSHGIIISVMWMLLFTVITACIMQIIYEYDFKALFHRPLEIVAAVVLVLLIYMGFMFDVTGYDRFVPDPDKVADAALVCENNALNYTSEEGEILSSRIYGEKYMHLENVEDIIAIAQYGQEFTRQAARDFSRTGTDDDYSAEKESKDRKNMPHPYEEFEMHVVYRMKNGTTISRDFRLPSTMDPAMMNAVVGTQKFREGSFGIYHDKAVRSDTDNCLMGCTNGESELFRHLTAEQYETFREAYIADLSAFSYTFARENVPVARVTFSRDAIPATYTQPGSEYFSISHPVYPSFSNTIKVLKDFGVWTEPLDYTPLLRGEYDYNSLSPKDQELYDKVDMTVFTGPFNRSNDYVTSYEHN